MKPDGMSGEGTGGALTTRHVATSLLLSGLSAVLLSGCSLLWLFNNDPEGLPCDFANDPDNGACLDGYTCVEREATDTAPVTFVCLKAGLKKVDESCFRKEECEVGLECATGFDSCNTNDDDINCGLVPVDKLKKVCRTACDINAAAECPPDQLCFANDDGQFCDVGTCQTDTDCAQLGGFCVGEALLGGKTGFCFQACDPLDCQAGECAQCIGLDGVPDADSNCIPIIDEAGPNGRNMCDVAGNIGAYGDCGNNTADRCTFGTFCISLDGVTAFCSPWARFPTGEPACPLGEDPIQVAGNLGFCPGP